MRYLRAAFLLILWPLLSGGCPNTGGGGGGNSNDNIAEGEGFCDGGSLSVLAVLTGADGEAGTMEYREFSNGCKEFIVRVTGTAEGTYDVFVSEVNVGAIVVDANGEGFLQYDSRSGTFPVGFPTPTRGDTGRVGDVLPGVFDGDCPAVAEFCTETDDGGDGDDNGGDGDGDLVTMTVTQRSLSGGAQFMTVYVCIGDEAYTRENAPYNAGCNQLQDTVDPIVRDYLVPIGSDVTLVAIEYTSSGTNSGSAAAKSNAAIYFVGWEGDDGEVTGEGVQHWVADRDLSVTLIWDIMPLVTWGKVNDNRPELGGGCFDFRMVAAPWLRQGSTEILQPTPRTCMSFGVNGEIILSGQLKPGSIVTLTASEGGLTGLEWVAWVGGPCGAARACTIEVAEQDVSTVAHWRTP